MEKRRRLKRDTEGVWKNEGKKKWNIGARNREVVGERVGRLPS